LATCEADMFTYLPISLFTDPASIRRYLEGVGLSADIPILSPARAPPQK
jgi:hypothetical protein